ncbi:calcium-binding protein [Massilia genomosp. 1]|uniref:Haemolysin-type calcium binding-related domain-containing protein n=1 Tax=Massilia genomosp. 1 TaxID=2609280 RepID=A0ABX0MP60_9BURK|nr:calcium-binding protein [Massilia genomosp. 1]NHZ62181.1 hypothetical protein [Massilia genomosp. 1]
MPLNTTTTTTTSNTAITNLATAVNGTAGNDTLNGGAADDVLNGLAGNDQLFGLAGNDILDGGAGNDFMNGGLGDDTYLFGRGDGRDIVYMSDVRPMSEVNTLRLKDGVLPSDLAFDMSGSSLLINIAGTSDQFRVDGFLYGNSTTNTANPLQQIVFADGTSWNLAEIQARLYAGSDGADVRAGTYLGDVIGGLGGDDQLDGKGGDDTIDGGADADTLIGGLGNDQLLGGAGNDSLSGDEGNDMLDGGTGDDNLNGGIGNDLLLGGAGKDAINGGAGADTLDGGAGDDVLRESEGNDVYLFGKGDGRDSIERSSMQAAGEINTLQFKAGVLTDGISLSNNLYGDLFIRLKASSDLITVDDFMHNDTSANNWSTVQVITFADGTSWNTAAIEAALFRGSDDADTVLGSLNADTISGQGGNDILEGKAGDDLLDGGAGADRLSGGAGNDRLFGGLGNDSLQGDAGDDTLDGNVGNDSLAGGQGNDTYMFGKGDGQDTLSGAGGQLTDAVDTLQFKAGVLPGDIVVTGNNAQGGAIIVKLRDSTDQVTVDSFLFQDNTGTSLNPLQQIRFADGTTWKLADIEAVLYAGSKEADTLNGTIKGELITGQAGADRLDGKAGNDTLDGGIGDDVIDGGTGSDTYLFGKGDGRDTIRALSDTAPGKIDTLQFKAGIGASDLVFSRSLDNLLIGIKGGTDLITVAGFLNNDSTSNASNPLQQIRFEDGATMDLAAITARLFATSDAADTINGTSGADLINGLGGADRLEGRGGNDTLDGGSGNDTLNGGDGNDTFLFSKGDGADQITLSYRGGIDTLQFKQGVLPGDVLLEASPYSELVIKIKGSADQVTIEQFMPNSDTSTDINALQQIQFADGTTWDLANIESQLYGGSAGADRVSGTANANIMFGLAGDDFLEGNAGNDTIDGGLGNDTIKGGGDSDTYLFGRGDGADKLMPTYEHSPGKVDVLQFKAGIAAADITLATLAGHLLIKIAGGSDQVRADGFLAQDDTANAGNPLQEIRFADGTVWNLAKMESVLYAGTSGAEEISGTVKADVISGQGGNDTINGKAGNDTIRGGGGDDQIVGGSGNDTYLFGKGDGKDILSANNGTAAGDIDTLQFDAGIAGADLQLGKSGTSLIIKIAGGTDQLTVYNFLSLTSTPNPANPLQQIKFADGVSWDLARIQAELLADTTPVPASAAWLETPPAQVDVALIGHATQFA